MDHSQRECRARVLGLILEAEQSLPLTADPHLFSRQAGACLENPSCRSHWTEEPLCSIFGEVPGIAETDFPLPSEQMPGYG